MIRRSEGTRRLFQQDVLLGEIIITGSDQPWLWGTVQPTEAFEQIRPLFDVFHQEEQARRLHSPTDHR